MIFRRRRRRPRPRRRLRRAIRPAGTRRRATGRRLPTRPPGRRLPATGGGYGPPQPGAPWGTDQYGRPYSEKSKIIAGVLQLVLGGVGAGRWYTGHYGIAIAQLLTCGGLGVWALIDGILMLVGNVTDAEGRPLRG